MIFSRSMGILYEFLYYIDVYFDDIDKLIENCFVEYFFIIPIRNGFL